MVLLKSPFDGKNPSWKFQAAAQCASLCVPFPSFTKASNRVENLLEARGLGLQLFFKGLSREMGVLTTLPLFVCCTVPLSDRLRQKPKTLQLDPAKPGLSWAAHLSHCPMGHGPWAGWALALQSHYAGGLAQVTCSKLQNGLESKMHALQHPAFKGLVPRVDPGVRVLGAFVAPQKSQTPPTFQTSFLLGMEPLAVGTLSMGQPEEKHRWLSCLRSSIPCSGLPGAPYAPPSNCHLPACIQAGEPYP